MKEDLVEDGLVTARWKTSVGVRILAYKEVPDEDW